MNTIDDIFVSDLAIERYEIIYIANGLWQIMAQCENGYLRTAKSKNRASLLSILWLNAFVDETKLQSLENNKTTYTLFDKKKEIHYTSQEDVVSALNKNTRYTTDNLKLTIDTQNARFTLKIGQDLIRAVA